METKKHHTKNLEKKRFLFFQIGLVLALTFTLIAFEWKSPYIIKKLEGTVPLDGEWEMPPLILEKKPDMPEPKEKQKLKPLSSELEIVDKHIQEDEPVEEDEPVVEIKELKWKLDEVEAEPPFYLIPEEPASFPGGEEALFKFLKKHLKYPKDALDVGVEGTVIISFIVGKDGEIKDVEVARSIKMLDAEALRVVNMMPKWSPGLQRGKPANVKINLPVKFSIAK